MLNRRAFIRAGSAGVLAATIPTPTNAFLAALVEGISILVTLWQGAKMVREIYEQTFGEEKEHINREISRVYQQSYITSYYAFHNHYNIDSLSNLNPGCECLHSKYQQNSTSLCCGVPNGAVFLPTGCIIALRTAIEELRGKYQQDNLFAYTRPLRYMRPIEPWRPLDPAGLDCKTDLLYYSPSGSVGLRWHITNVRSRRCRGEYLIRDDYSSRVIASGQTLEFEF